MKNSLLTVLAIFIAPTVTSAEDFAPTGLVSRVWVAGGQNKGFRVYLKNKDTDPLSSCSYSFAYIDASHDNYQAAVSTLLSSYYQSKPVKLHATKEPTGFCRIDEVEG